MVDFPCINTNDVGGASALKRFDKNGDGRLCPAEVQSPDTVEVGNELTALNQLASDNGVSFETILSKALISADGKVTALNLYGLKIKNIRALAKLTSLKDLSLSSTQVTDISALAKLPLERLYLGGLSIKDFSPLANMGSLEILYLYGSNVKPGDLKHLEKLPNFVHLNVISSGKNKKDNLEALSKEEQALLQAAKEFQTTALKEGRYIRLIENEKLALQMPVIGAKLNDGQFLTLTKFATENGLRVDSILRGAGVDANGNVIALNLAGMKITNVSALKDLPQLEVLILYDTEVKEVSTLAGLTSLKELSLSGTKVTDISALQGLTNMERLYLSNLEITDLGALASMGNLEILYIDGTDVAEIDVLKGSKNLKHLCVERQKPTKVPKEDIKGLQEELPGLRLMQY